MNILNWVSTDVVGGTLFHCEEAEEYEIFFQHFYDAEGSIPPDRFGGGFFVRRLVADCDDTGPLSTFAEAEGVLIQFLAMLVAFEEQAWRIVAASVIRNHTTTGSDTPPVPAQLELFPQEVP